MKPLRNLLQMFLKCMYPERKMLLKFKLQLNTSKYIWKIVYKLLLGPKILIGVDVKIYFLNAFPKSGY